MSGSLAQIKKRSAWFRWLELMLKCSDKTPKIYVHFMPLPDIELSTGVEIKSQGYPHVL